MGEHNKSLLVAASQRLSYPHPFRPSAFYSVPVVNFSLKT